MKLIFYIYTAIKLNNTYENSIFIIIRWINITIRFNERVYNEIII